MTLTFAGQHLRACYTARQLPELCLNLQLRAELRHTGYRAGSATRYLWRCAAHGSGEVPCTTATQPAIMRDGNIHSPLASHSVARKDAILKGMSSASGRRIPPRRRRANGHSRHRLPGHIWAAHTTTDDGHLSDAFNDAREGQFRWTSASAERAVTGVTIHYRNILCSYLLFSATSCIIYSVLKPAPLPIPRYLPVPHHLSGRTALFVSNLPVIS